MKRTPATLVLGAVLLVLFTIACGTKGTIPQIGDKAPDFALQDVNGNTVRLSQFRGKTVLLVFASVNCKGCEDQMPFLVSVAEQEKGDLVILEVYVNNGASVVRDYTARKGFTHFPSLPDPKGELAARYDPAALKFPPTNFIIDGNGIIRYKKTGPFSSAEEISSVIKSL